MNIVLLSKTELDTHGHARLEDTRARHVLDVLGLGVGGRFRIGVVDGPLGFAEITGALDGAIDVTATLEASPPEPPAIDLVLALPRPKVLARLLSPIAQLGVRRLMLTAAWKVEKYYFDAHILSPAEHVPKLLEGLAQASDTRFPIVTVHRSFAFLVDHELDALVPNTARIVVDPSASVGLEAALVRFASPRIVLAIGPEGGFTARELTHLADGGFTLASLGGRVLRSDVATIAALARAQAALASRP